MRLSIEAACGCNIGKVRKNNEDNFFFDGKCLELENRGLHNTAYIYDTLKSGLFFAVFDGMGGENYGEVASFSAARQMQQVTRSLSDYFISERKYLLKLTAQINDAVVKAKKELYTDRCGSTMVALYFSSGYVYACNVGDSRAYRLRNGEFLQLSVDHIEKRSEGEYKKAPLTQYLGIDPEEMLIEPNVAKGKISKGDIYLLCSDGLTDMLTNFEISDILLSCGDSGDCVKKLIQVALEHGGRDNITVIVCKID